MEVLEIIPTDLKSAIHILQKPCGKYIDISKIRQEISILKRKRKDELISMILDLKIKHN